MSGLVPRTRLTHRTVSACRRSRRADSPADKTPAAWQALQRPWKRVGAPLHPWTPFARAMPGWVQKRCAVLDWRRGRRPATAVCRSPLACPCRPALPCRWFFYLEAATRPRCGKPCKPRDLRRWCAGGAPVVRWHAASAMPQLGAGPGDKRATDADFGAPQQIGGQWPQPGPAHRRLRARPASDHGVIFGGIFGANFGGIPGISQTACPWPPATRPAPAAARPA